MEHADTDYPRRERFSCTNRPRSRSFFAAQLRGIKVGLYFPEENHWVLKPNAQVWQKILQMAQRNLVD
jgi:hypothetical protein